MKSFTKTSLFVLSAVFISSMSLGFACDPAQPTEETKPVAESLVCEPAEIAEDSENKPLPDSISCGECGKRNHYADCGCGKKKKNKLEVA